MKKILIIGGYGNVSRFLSPLLLEHTDSSIIIAGRNPDKANAFRDELAVRFDKDIISTEMIDASDAQSLITAFEKADFIVNSASTIKYTDLIVEALLETKKDYLDLLLSSPQKLDPLRKVNEIFVNNNQCVITDGGFHPGVPLAMVKYASQYFDELYKANVGSLLNIDWKFENSSQSTVDEFILEIKDYDTTAFAEGRWQRLSYSSTKTFDFGKPFGSRKCLPMNLEEMKLITTYYKDMIEGGFYVAGFNWLADYFLLPGLMMGFKILPVQQLTPLIKLFFWSLRHFNKPPYRTILQLEAEGNKEGKPKQYKMSISHGDGYAMTAIPAAACIIQYLEGTIRKPGLHFQAEIVDPVKFINSLKNLGCGVTEE